MKCEVGFNSSQFNVREDAGHVNVTIAVLSKVLHEEVKIFVTTDTLTGTFIIGIASMLGPRPQGCSQKGLDFRTYNPRSYHAISIIYPDWSVLWLPMPRM